MRPPCMRRWAVCVKSARCVLNRGADAAGQHAGRTAIRGPGRPAATKLPKE